VLHIRPWETDQLTAAELEQACRYIDELNEKAKR
jgi:hypothetical protein